MASAEPAIAAAAATAASKEEEEKGMACARQGEWQNEMDRRIENSTREREVVLLEVAVVSKRTEHLCMASKILLHDLSSMTESELSPSARNAQEPLRSYWALDEVWKRGGDSQIPTGSSSSSVASNTADLMDLQTATRAAGKQTALSPSSEPLKRESNHSTHLLSSSSMMKRVDGSAARESGRTKIVALVVLGLVVVSVLNYYGMATVARANTEGSNALPALHSAVPAQAHHLKRETEGHGADRNGTAHSNETVSVQDATVMQAAVTTEQPKQTHAQLYQGKEDPNEMHIVFSMSCTQGRRLLLQTVFQFSAMAVGQRGPITQILSGCTDAEREAVLKEPTFYYDFRRHFTPSYSPHPEPGIDDVYTPYNKPFALRHFLQHADPPVNHKLLTLVDGDFVFFKPLEVNTGRSMAKYYHGSRDKSTVTDRVEDGYAIAQDWYNYMGSGWFSESNKEKLEHLCKGKPCMDVTKEDAGEYFAGTGPPYIMTVNDMKRMINDYAHFVVLGRNKTTDWMVEMYAYAVSAANHNIKHTVLSNLGVTHPQFVDGNREYWDFAPDDMQNPCEDPLSVVIPEDPPVGVHYCQKYGFVLTEKNAYHYYKYKIPTEIIECNSPLLKLPPATEWTDAVKIKDLKLRSRKRHEVWTECSIIKIVNQALTKLKQRTCPLGFNAFQGTELRGDKETR